ncbi:MAG: hypothetical protein WCW66_00285 [Patescibacteria group bacterium]
MKTLDMNPSLDISESTDTHDTIPSLDFIKSQTASINGKILLVGLSIEQAEAIKQLAEENGLEITDTELSDEEFDRLSSIRFPNVTKGSKTLYLNRNSDCLLELYRLLT